MPTIDQLSEKEKINIYIEEKTFSTLEHDMDVFEVCRKKNGEINRNDFLARLIVNYGKQYRDSMDTVRNEIKETLNKYWPEGKYYHDLMTADILSDIIAKGDINKIHTDTTLAFRPQKKNEELQFELEDISEYLSEREGISISDYFRSMLETYCALPQFEREKIILLRNYREIQTAIRSRKIIRIITIYDESILCTPYALVANKAGTHNYLIGIIDGQVIPRILNRIKSVKRIDGQYVIPEELKQVLEERKKNPEYAFQEETEVYVMFNEAGLTELKLIKTGRPKRIGGSPEIPDTVAAAASEWQKNREGKWQLAVFRCTEAQANYYFRRFGGNAYVISPQELNDRLAEFFQTAADQYHK